MLLCLAREFHHVQQCKQGFDRLSAIWQAKGVFATARVYFRHFGRQSPGCTFHVFMHCPSRVLVSERPCPRKQQLNKALQQSQSPATSRWQGGLLLSSQWPCIAQTAKGYQSTHRASVVPSNRLPMHSGRRRCLSSHMALLPGRGMSFECTLCWQQQRHQGRRMRPAAKDTTAHARQVRQARPAPAQARARPAPPATACAGR